jgi:hypothetical protein
MTAREAPVVAEQARGQIAGAQSVAVRCNAPQRTPRAPDTEWGRPRAQLGWSLRFLAEVTGINAPELSRIERGRACPTREQARRLNAAYHEAGV